MPLITPHPQKSESKSPPKSAAISLPTPAFPTKKTPSSKKRARVPNWSRRIQIKNLYTKRCAPGFLDAVAIVRPSRFRMRAFLSCADGTGLDCRLYATCCLYALDNSRALRVELRGIAVVRFLLALKKVSAQVLPDQDLQATTAARASRRTTPLMGRSRPTGSSSAPQ